VAFLRKDGLHQKLDGRLIVDDEQLRHAIIPPLHAHKAGTDTGSGRSAASSLTVCIGLTAKNLYLVKALKPPLGTVVSSHVPAGVE